MEELSYTGIISFAVALFNRFRKLFAINVVLSVFLTIIDGLSIFSIAPIVSLIQDGGSGDYLSSYIISVFEKYGTPVNLEFFILLFVTLSITRVLMRAGIECFILKTKYYVIHDVTLEVVNKILVASMSFVKDQRQGDFVNAMFLELSKVGDAFTALSRIIAPLIQMSVLIVIPLFVSWQVTFVSILVVILLSAPLELINKYLYKFGRSNTLSGNEYNVVLQETFSQLRLILGFGNKKTAIKRIDDAFNTHKKNSIYLQSVQIIVKSAYGPIGILVVLVTFLIGKKFNVPTSEIIVMIYSFYRLASCGTEFVGYKNILLSVYPAYEIVMSTAENAFKSKIKSGNIKFDDLQVGIKLENVNYYYPASGGDAKPYHALRDINLMIASGKITAVVGKSGSGKSTLIDIVMGLLNCTDGELLFDNINISDIDIDSLHHKIGYVPQGNELFHDSIKNNVLWGNPTASDEEVTSICKLAHAHEFIEKLENGYDTLVGDKGAKLSGGQIQRIALARALIRKPKILILDEATSALDSSSEKQIQLAINKISKKTTVLVIAHRLSTIANADYIYVFDDGYVKEEGAYTTLINNDGIFSELIKLQQL